MHSVKSALLAIAVAAGPLSAHAALVDGDLIVYQGYSSTSGAVTYGAPVDYTAGSGTAAGIPGSPSAPFATLQTSGNVVTIDITSSFSPPACASQCLQGGSISIVGQNVNSISNLASTIPGFVALPGAGAENGVAFVQFEGLNAAAGETISFDINAAPVPVPTALPLLLSGVGGLGLLFRRRTTAPISAK